MLKCTPSNLWQEIQAAERFRDSHLSSLNEMIDAYTGPAYKTGISGAFAPENHAVQYLRITAGKQVFGNPKVIVRSRRAMHQRMIAQAMRSGLNRWIADVKLRKLLQRIYFSQYFSWSVAMTVMQPARWMDPRRASNPWLPACYMIENDRFYFDPLANWYGAARFAGHKYARDKEDVLNEAKENPDLGWNVKAINDVTEGAGVDELRDHNPDRDSGAPRNEIVLHETWVPEKEMLDPADGFHGTIYTTAVGGSGGDIGDAQDDGNWIREPRAYYGPRWGPYTMFGSFPVPNDPFPLSPSVVSWPQQRQVNDVVNASNEQIKKYKRLILVSADNTDLAMKLKSPDSLVIPIKGLQKDQAIPFEMGGITEQHIKQIELSLDRLDRTTGLSQLARGNLGEADSATEASIAENSFQDSLAFVKQEFTDSSIQLLESVGWYLFYDDRIDFALGDDPSMGMVDPMTGQPMMDPRFHGGSYEDGSGATYDDLELEIEPYSMERMNQALARAQYMEMMQLMSNVATLIPSTPYYNWRTMFEKGGEVMNDPTFADVFDADIAAQMAGMQMAASMPAPIGRLAKMNGGGPGGARPVPGSRPQLPGRTSGNMLGAQQRKVGY